MLLCLSLLSKYKYQTKRKKLIFNSRVSTQTTCMPSMPFMVHFNGHRKLDRLLQSEQPELSIFQTIPERQS